MTCRAGHPRTDENTYRRANGTITCRVCLRIQRQKLYDANYRSLKVTPYVRDPKPTGANHA